MTQTKKQGRLRRRLYALTVALALVVSLFSGIPARKMVHADPLNTFSLYYYYEGDKDLYVDIWNWAGISFDDTVTSSDVFSWNKWLGKLEEVEENWYKIDFKINSSTEADGFDIYDEDQVKLTGYGSNNDDYKTMVSGNNSSYYIKGGSIYTYNPDYRVVLYYYYDGEASIFLDIWSHNGFEFASSATLSDEFGWNNKQGVMNAVANKEGWYSIPLDIIDGSKDDGFDIYLNDKNTKASTYDNKTNHADDYAKIVSAQYGEIFIKNGTLYTSDPDEEEVENLLSNGNFETGNTTGWTIDSAHNVKNEVKVGTGSNNTTKILNIYGQNANNSFLLSQSVVLEEGTYKLSFDQDGAEGIVSGLKLYINGKQIISLPATKGWNGWETITQEFNIVKDAGEEIEIRISGSVGNGYWCDFDNFVLEKIDDNADALNVDKTTYSIVSGDNESLNIDTETDDLEFVISCAKSVLSSVLVDKEALGKDDFTVSDYKNGNDTITKVTLKNSFLKSLDAEKHTIAFEFSDAEAIEGSFEITEIPTGIQNGSFEDEVIYWQGNIGWKQQTGSETFAIKKGGDDSNPSNYLDVWTNKADEQSITQTFKAEESGEYNISYRVIGDVETYGDTGFAIYVNDKKVGDITSKSWSAGWKNCKTDAFELKEGDIVTLSIKGKFSMWFGLDDIALEEYVDTTVKGDLTIKKVDNLSEEFANGVDISAIHSIYASGAYCRDFDGNKLSEADFFGFLTENGVNYVRIRVWNNPYDSKGNGYGGGNNDLAAAKIMGKYASEAGMKVLIDFHFSDFWADPSKQKAPKAWAGKTVKQKAAAISDYVTSSLNELIDAGVNVEMVQIGNETNAFFCGENDWENLSILFDAGCDAVHAVAEAKNKPIRAVLHFTDPQSENKQAGYAENLDKYDVSYDVFASSYYPYWHGSLDNLESVLSYIAETYEKDVMVAETSYAWTLDDGDGHSNTVSRGGNNDVEDCIYPFTVAGQAAWVRDVVDTVNSIRTEGGTGIGVFYWEAAWIPVNYYDPEAADAEKVLAANKAAWEKYGSGWASSYSADYDPEDAGQWYGGSAIDNQAFFGFDGTALDSLKVYSYMYTGSVTAKKFDCAEDVKETVEYADLNTFEMPGTTKIWFNDMSTSEADVVWDKDQLAAALKEAKASGHGEYEIDGTVTYDGVTVNIIGKITVIPDNLLVNGSFEDGENGWTIDRTNEGDNVKDKSNGQAGSPSAHDGTKSFHFWSDTDQSFEVSQEVTLKPGVYALNGYFQGFAGVEGELFAIVGDTEYAAPYELNGWNNWQNPIVDRIIITKETKVTVGFRCNYNAEAWGTCDDFYLFKEANIFTVTFDVNGHGIAPDPVFVVEGESVEEPYPSPSAEHYWFVGWCTADGIKTRTEFEFSTAITEDITLYALWDLDVYYDLEQTLKGGIIWMPGIPLIITAHRSVNDAQTINHFSDAEIARVLPGADADEIVRELSANGLEATAKADYSRFTPFEAIGGSNMRAESGSLKLTIFDSYLETLEPGEYIIRIVFDDGEVFTKLTINAKAADDEVEPDDNKAADADVKPADDAGATTNDTAPKTADETPIEAAMLILLISAAGLSYILGLKRKRS